MTESFNLWGLSLHGCAGVECDVAAVLMGALLVALAVFAVCARLLR